MKQLHSGWDYTLYKVYIWGGLPLLVIYIVVVALTLDMHNLLSTAGLFITVPLMLWVTGILLYWWWVFLFKGNKELEELARSPGEGLPGIKSLKNWNTLHQAMTIYGGNVEEFIKNAKRANRPIIVWYGSSNLLVLWIFGPILLSSLGIIAQDAQEMAWIWPVGVVAWVVLMLVGTPALLSWGGKSAENAYLAPLGLAVTRTPGLTADVVGLMGGGQRLIPDGPAIVEGERQGRLVHIETSGKHSLTVLQARLPEFKVQSDDGKLVPGEDAPDEVVKALKSLRKAKRWQGITLRAGPEGIGVQRQSKGTNMWLYDLWLLEYLVDGING